MNKTILTQVDGWTPTIDALTRRYGLEASAVFGRVWRYCQGSEGRCSAAVETIAEELGLSERTVRRKIDLLDEEGYLRKESRPGKASLIFDTGKARISSKVSAEIQGEETPDTESDPPEARSESPRTPDTESGVGRSESPRTPDTESDKERLREVGKRGEREGLPTLDNAQAAMVGVLSFVTGLDYKIKRNAGRMARAAGELLEADYHPLEILEGFTKGDTVPPHLPEAILLHYLDAGGAPPAGWWWHEDWRGRKGTRPTPEQVLETAGQAVAWVRDLDTAGPDVDELQRQMQEARARVEQEAVDA